jgi:hypothetical protein
MNGELQRANWDAVSKRAAAIGLSAFALSIGWGFLNPPQFFRSYLAAFVFWISLPLGSFALLLLHHLVGGRWGFLIQRLIESAVRTFPIMAALFVPLLFGLPYLYPWARPELVAADPVLQQKSLYLNVWFFAVRAAIYFVIWISVGYFLNRWSEEQDRAAGSSFISRFQRLSGPGLVLYGLTVTFSAIDWIMSLEPHWYSTIFGMIFMVSHGLAAMSFVICMVSRLEDEKPLVSIATPDRFHDLGNLLLAFVMLWAYMSFSQFMLVWVENLKEEIPWYLRRTGGGWEWLAIALIIFQFALPFILLLSRVTKRRARVLSRVALWILFMHWVEIVWMVMPAFYPDAFHFHLLDMLAPVAIGGIWLGAFLRYLARRSLLPLGDPRLAAILEQET